MSQQFIKSLKILQTIFSRNRISFCRILQKFIQSKGVCPELLRSFKFYYFRQTTFFGADALTVLYSSHQFAYPPLKEQGNKVIFQFFQLIFDLSIFKFGFKFSDFQNRKMRSSYMQYKQRLRAIQYTGSYQTAAPRQKNTRSVQ